MVFLVVGTLNGLGVHQSYLTSNERQLSILCGWVNQMLILVAIGLTKIAIVIFLLRIQGYFEIKSFAFLWFLAGSNFVINCITFPFILTQCSPVQKLWNEGLRGTCEGRKRTQIMGYYQGCKYTTFLACT